jgi:1-acyl-sn-glycerol-3-phosphate acyltransferase
MAGDETDVQPPRRWELAFYRVIRAVLVGFARLYFRLQVEGADRVPATGAFVLAPVHRSNIDFLLVSAVTRRRMRYMGKDSIWKFAWLGPLFNALGAFPVHRGTADREALRTCMAVVQTGEPVVMFPEGTRQSGPIVQPLFDGPAYVAARAGIPIVPVGIGGSEAAMPRGSKLIRPTRVVLIVGEPIHPPAAVDAGARVPRRVVREVTEKLQAEVQRLFDAAQARVT